MTGNEEAREAAEPAAPAKSSPYTELGAMGSAFAALAVLDYAAQDRALMWLNSRLRWARNDDSEPF